MSTAAVLKNANPHDRKFHDTEAPYILPNDNPEHQRLELQAARLRSLMGKVFHAPLDSSLINKVLDIGCGTGIVTHELAQTFPNASVCGVDLSPIPVVREKLPNITYITGNIMDTDTRFQEASFDYIFSRLLVLGISDWPAYIQRCVSLLKPGAYFEQHDYDMQTYRLPSTLSPTEITHLLRPQTLTLSQFTSTPDPTSPFISLHPWFPTLDRLAHAKGINIRIGHKLGSLFSAAGLDDIKITRYMVPIGNWKAGGLSEVEQEFAPLYQSFWGSVIPMLLRKLGGEVDLGAVGVGEEEIEKAVKDAVERSEEWDGEREFLYMYVVSGRKGL